MLMRRTGPARTASGASPSWPPPTPTRNPRRAPRGRGCGPTWSRPSTAPPSTRAAPSPSPAPPTCGSSAPCGRSRTSWWWARRRCGRRGTARPARVLEFAGAREAAGQGPAPAIAVVSASLELDFTLPLFTSPLVPTLILTGAAAAPDRVAAAEKAGARVLIAGAGMGVEPARAVQAPGRPRPHPAAHRGRPLAARPADRRGGAGRAVPDRLADAHRGQRPAHRRGPSVAVPHRFELVSLLEEGRIPVRSLPSVLKERNPPFRLASGWADLDRQYPCDHGEGWFRRGPCRAL